MRKLFLPALASLLLLNGCAHGYVLKMSNGETVRTGTKPKLVNGFYYFKDANGNPARPVFAANVSEIAPASMSSKSSGPAFRNLESK